MNDSGSNQPTASDLPQGVSPAISPTTLNPTASSSASDTQNKGENEVIKKMFAVFAGVILFLIAGVVGVYVLFIQPKVKMITFSKNLLVQSPKVRSTVTKVDESLNKIYSIITQSGDSAESNKLLLRLDTSDFLTKLKVMNKEKGEVAGASTERQLNELVLFSDNISKIGKNLKNTSTFGGSKKDVLGEQSLEPTVVTALRELKEASNVTLQLSKDGTSRLGELKNTLSQERPKNAILELDRIISKLESINNQAGVYFSESTKTANYYYKVVDLRIELTPFLSSYASLLQGIAQSSTPQLYLSRLTELQTTITKLNSSLNLIRKEDLPAGIEALHEDNIKTLELLKTNLAEVKSAVEQGDYVAFLKSVVLLQQNLEPLATRAVTLELNFWQNNKSIKEGIKLKKSYQDEEKSINKFIETNKLPFISS